MPKGPGQRSRLLIAVHKGGELTEIGRHYGLSNVRVMPAAGMIRCKQLKSGLQGLPDGWIMSGI